MQTRVEIIAALSRELGNSEETEHLIDWLLDVWETVDILVERFGAECARSMLLAESAAPATPIHELLIGIHEVLASKGGE
jgi:hypothetical protein